MLHTGYFFSFFIIEVIRNVDHSAHLLYIKGAAAFTVAAVETGIRLDGKLCIVIGGNGISRQSQIVILVHEANVDTGRTRLTVVAVDAGTSDGIGSEGSDDGIVLFFLSCLQEFENLIQVIHSLHTGNCHQNTGAVDGVLQTLAVGQSLPKGRMLRA